jgi:hypothetical protein
MDHGVRAIERELQPREIPDIPEHEVQLGIREPLAHLRLLHLIAALR